MTDEPEKIPKVVNLSDARKRQKLPRVDPAGRIMKAKGKAPRSGGGRSIWTYVQFVLFLGAIAYFMQLCSSESMF